MTLLSITNDAADYSLGPRPATIIGNTEPDAQTLLRLANRAGFNLMRLFQWQALWKQREFTAIAGDEQTGAIPSDFNRFIAESFWDKDLRALVSGPISASEWAGLRTESAFDSRIKKFIWRGDSIFTIPDLGSGVSCEFQYVSKNWCTDTTGATPKAKFTVDTDLSLLDEDLMASIVAADWLESQGQPFAAARQYAEDSYELLTTNESASEDILVVADVFGRASRHYDFQPRTSRLFWQGTGS